MDLLSSLGSKDGQRAECVALNADGRLLAVAYQDRHVPLWELPAGRERSPLIDHTDQVTALAFSPDWRTLGSGSGDRTIKLWSLAAYVEVAALEGHHGSNFCKISFPATQAAGKLI